MNINSKVTISAWALIMSLHIFSIVLWLYFFIQEIIIDPLKQGETLKYIISWNNTGYGISIGIVLILGLFGSATVNRNSNQKYNRILKLFLLITTLLALYVVSISVLYLSGFYI